MRHPNPDVIHLLRDMAAQRRSVTEMVRSVGARFAAPALSPVDVVRAFREAFGLTLAQAKPIADWLAYGGDDQSETALHDLIWPYIESNQDSWRQPVP